MRSLHADEQRRFDTLGYGEGAGDGANGKGGAEGRSAKSRTAVRSRPVRSSAGGSSIGSGGSGGRRSNSIGRRPSSALAAAADGRRSPPTLERASSARKLQVGSVRPLGVGAGVGKRRRGGRGSANRGCREGRMFFLQPSSSCLVSD